VALRSLGAFIPTTTFIRDLRPLLQIRVEGRPWVPDRQLWVPVGLRVCVWIPAFLEATMDPRQVRDNSGSQKPLEALLWVPVVSCFADPAVRSA
jgi:hypothetical protein